MNNQDLFENLSREGIQTTEEQRKNINRRINEVLNYEPKVGVFGKTGVGKSSLCNALFGQDVCEISDVEACTRNPQEVLLHMGGKKITLVDVPGAGENKDRDREYAQLYSKILPELDVALWVIKADDRAMSSDEAFFKQIVKPHVEQGKVFFFVLNQCDKIEPFREWNESGHEPGPKQLQNIQRKITDIATRFSVPESKIIPVSACEKYYLVRLIDEMVFAMPKDKKITIVNSAARENVSAQAQEELYMDFRLEECRTEDDVREVLHRYVNFYNKQRPCFALDYDTPDHYCERFNRGELEHRDTFSQRVLSEKPKFMQKKRTTKK